MAHQTCNTEVQFLFTKKKKSQTSNDKQGHYNSTSDNEINKLSGTFIFFIPCILNCLK